MLGHIHLRVYHFALLPALLLLPARYAVAVDKGFERIEFDPPRQANIRVRSGVAVRDCQLHAISREAVILETGTGARARRTEIELDRVLSIFTTDREFRYQAGDRFDRLIEYAKELDGVSIGDARELYEKDSESLRNRYGVVGSTEEKDPSPPPNAPPPGGFQPSRTRPGEASSTPGGFASGGFGPADAPVQPNHAPAGDSQSSGDAAREGAPNGASEASYPNLYGADDTRPQQASDEIFVCSNCRKDVTLSAIQDSRCPHCGILLLLERAGPGNALAMNNPPEGGRAAPARAAAPAPAQGAAAAPGGPIQMPPPPPPAPAAPAGAAGPTELDLKSMPVWMKAAFFFGAIGIGYYFVFYRR